MVNVESVTILGCHAGYVLVMAEPVDWRSRLGKPRLLVLYKSTRQWRHAIYGASGNVLDGHLRLHVDAPAEEAQAELVRIASEIAQMPLTVEWTVAERPGFWAGQVTDPSLDCCCHQPDDPSAQPFAHALHNGVCVPRIGGAGRGQPALPAPRGPSGMRGKGQPAGL
jgi:hypothetical protein